MAEPGASARARLALGERAARVVLGTHHQTVGASGREGEGDMTSYFDKDSLARRDLGPWFPAKYYGTCAECPRKIEKGDEVRYKDGAVVCEHCGNDEPPPVEKPAVICTSCFIALSDREQRAGRKTHIEC